MGVRNPLYTIAMREKESSIMITRSLNRHLKKRDLTAWFPQINVIARVARSRFKFTRPFSSLSVKVVQIRIHAMPRQLNCLLAQHIGQSKCT